MQRRLPDTRAHSYAPRGLCHRLPLGPPPLCNHSSFSSSHTGLPILPWRCQESSCLRTLVIPFVFAWNGLFQGPTCTTQLSLFSLFLWQVSGRSSLNSQYKRAPPSPELPICFALPYCPTGHLSAPRNMGLHGHLFTVCPSKLSSERTWLLGLPLHPEPRSVRHTAGAQEMVTKLEKGVILLSDLPSQINHEDK